MGELLTTSIPSLPEPRRGKVREVYDLGQHLLIVATDRLSAFDVVMANGIPGKGVILNQMSAFWFAKFAGLCPHHVISTNDEKVAEAIGVRLPALAGRCTLARKAKPLAIECVARGYLAGSLYKEYRKLGGGVHELDLPEGLLDSDRLPEPIFTPATKAQTGHDENISFETMCKLIDPGLASKLRELTLAIYGRAA
ncbi:MAG: phosphoribosylaminoimidazolesuccinocarboxamide synthase, partial [Fimbriimonas ginsengisoli]|nr:phosphoribosylaminoimidazolesuccinocarboxamide synthase [Fimbriimonas ginsengisoli]